MNNIDDLNSFIKETFIDDKEYIYENPLDLSLEDFVDSQIFQLEIGLKEENSEIINKAVILGRISGLVSAWCVHHKTGATGDFNRYNKTREIYEKLTQQDDD